MKLLMNIGDWGTYVLLNLMHVPCAETLDWELNCDPQFRSRWWRECEVLSEGEWGRVVRLFYHIFYGEGLVLHPGTKYQQQPNHRPYAGQFSMEPPIKDSLIREHK